MSAISGVSGTVPSGDVSLWYRCFGEAGGMPVLLLHGANYYDGRDWVDVALHLARERPVCIYDARGFGLSGWSKSRDYSPAAHLMDLAAMLDHLAWERAILVGHSRGGGLALRYAHQSPARVAGLSLVDFSPGRQPRRAQRHEGAAVFHRPAYPSLELAHADTSRNPGEFETEAGRARAESIFGQRDGAWVNVRRDPAYAQDRAALTASDSVRDPPLDLWDALGRALERGIPCQVVRAIRSQAYDQAALSRLARDFAAVDVHDVPSGHDVAGEAPSELIAALVPFLASINEPSNASKNVDDPTSGG
jgi:pimeloyl-ACP methyl ester carboxylesterase